MLILQDEAWLLADNSEATVKTQIVTCLILGSKGEYKL